MQIIRGIFAIGLVCFIQISTASDIQLDCVDSSLPHTNLTDMVDECTQKMKAQVQVELTASMTYLSLGAHFSRDVVNRPGFAKLFFESAREERDHAIKIISYLLMRGELTKDAAELIRNPKPASDFDFELRTAQPGFRALESALKLEKSVTENIRGIIKTCEQATLNQKEKDAKKKKEAKNYEDGTNNDYHLVDYLTSDFLDEQYKGQREIAGKIETLHKLSGAHGYDLGEFLFDKKLLNGNLL